MAGSLIGKFYNLTVNFAFFIKRFFKAICFSLKDFFPLALILCFIMEKFFFFDFCLFVFDALGSFLSL